MNYKAHQNLKTESLKFWHLIKSDFNTDNNTLGKFQILLFRKWISSLQNIIYQPSLIQMMNCNVAIENETIIAYLMSESNNRKGTCWSIYETNIIRDPKNFSISNIQRALIRKTFENAFNNNHSWLMTVNINDTQQLSISRELGFQPLKVIKYWIPPLTAKVKAKSLLESSANIQKKEINKEFSQQLWRLEQSRESINIRSIFDRSWHDIYERKHTNSAVLINKKDNKDIVIAGIINSICPLNKSSMELIRGVAWDERLENNLESLINNLLVTNKTIYLETSSQDTKLNNLLMSIGWKDKEERILLGKSIWKRQRNTKLTTIKSELTNILGNIEQTPDLQSPTNIQKY